MCTVALILMVIGIVWYVIDTPDNNESIIEDSQ